jgi:tRNA(Ile)-lysidine synthase
MLTHIERSLRTECRIEPGAALIAGVSGGQDSLCLLHALCALGHRPVVAYFDHQLRPESVAEAAHVGQLASSLGLQFVAGRENVGAYSHAKRISIEAAGRSLRYAFLFDQAHKHDAVAVAVGHTADDQAETILMHLVRGASMAGLGGMAYRVVLPEIDSSTPIVRPLLGVWRKQTLEYCRSNDLRPLHDASNESREFLRNRVRLDLIPSLESYNPQVRLALWRLSQLVTDDQRLIQDLVSMAWDRTVVGQGAAYIGFDAVKLADESRALQRRLVMLAAMRLKPGSEFDFEDMQRAQAFIADPSRRCLQLSRGVMLYRESETVFLTLGEDKLPADGWPQLPREHIALNLEDPVAVPLGGGWQLTTEIVSGTADPVATFSAQDAYRGILDADSLPRELELRAPKPGDRIQPLGLKGHTQKLSDIFINMGVPERLRKQWPVLVRGEEVVWVPGFRIAEPYRIREDTRRAVLIALRRPE